MQLLMILVISMGIGFVADNQEIKKTLCNLNTLAISKSISLKYDDRPNTSLS